VPVTDSADVESAASRLYDAVVVSRREGAGFPEALSDALAAALRLFEAEPQVAETLFGDHSQLPDSVERCVRWQRRFAALLKEEAREAGCLETPFNLELVLIGGATAQIGEGLRPPAIPGPELHASLLEIFLTYYLEPEELRAAVLAGRASFS